MDAGSDREPMDAGATAKPARGDARAGHNAPCKDFVMPKDCTVPRGAVLPGELRCTGLYGDADSQQLACGIEAYAPAYELWADNAEKHRYISMPPGKTIDVSDPDNFKFPVGTQLWKEFRVEVSGKRRPSETRLLRKSDKGWLYTSYVWSDDGKRATQQNDGVTDWLGSGHDVPTRDQCRECHEGRTDLALGWDLLMLGDGATGMTRGELAKRGLLSAGGKTLAADAPQLKAAIPGNDTERAALGYLHANCGVSCHNATPDAAARDTGLMLRLEHAMLDRAQETPAIATGANRLPAPNSKMPPGGPFYDLLPGDPEHSLLVARMNVRGTEAQMPRVGTRLVDDRGVGVVKRWIEGMTQEAQYPAAAPVENGLEPGPQNDPNAPPPSDAGLPPGAATSVDCSSGPDTRGLGYDVVMRDGKLSVATFAAQAPGSDDWYVVDMVGTIWQLHDGKLSDDPFLDLRDAVQLGAGFDQTTLTYDERGLVGLAFAPDYESSGLFYVAITPSRANGRGLPVNQDQVLEFQRKDASAPELTRTLLDVGSSSALLGNIHNFNTVRFGPDGYLYVGSGDGGGVACNDAERGAAQDIGSVFGKILRLDPSAGAPYGAPGNPFAANGDPRVFHYGVRNPFRFSFDRQTGDLYLGDVGQDTYEELDFAPSGSSGMNFGWPTYEANAPCPGSFTPISGPSEPSAPIFVANRSAFATGPFSDYRAITGGIVYRGTALKALLGAYLFGDYYGRRLGALYQCSDGTSNVSQLAKACDPNDPNAGCLPTPDGSPRFDSLTAIVEDHAGEIYFVANGNSLLKLVARP
jgi:hypothetical protein